MDPNLPRDLCRYFCSLCGAIVVFNLISFPVMYPKEMIKIQVLMGPLSSEIGFNFSCKLIITAVVRNINFCLLSSYMHQRAETAAHYDTFIFYQQNNYNVTINICNTQTPKINFQLFKMHLRFLEILGILKVLIHGPIKRKPLVMHCTCNKKGLRLNWVNIALALLDNKNTISIFPICKVTFISGTKPAAEGRGENFLVVQVHLRTQLKKSRPQSCVFDYTIALCICL